MKYVSDTQTNQTSGEVLQTAREGAAHVKDAVAEEASRTIDSIKAAAKDQVKRGKSELTDSLKSVDKALRRTSSEMENPTLAPQVERIADAVTTAHQFIEEHQVEDLGKAVRRLSLQHPVLFYSGIFALGFAAGRFFSSSQNRLLEPSELDVNLLDEDLAAPVTSRPMVNPHGPH